MLALKQELPSEDQSDNYVAPTNRVNKALELQNTYLCSHSHLAILVNALPGHTCVLRTHR